MHVKREISVSSMNNVSDSIKRLAISHDGHPQRIIKDNKVLQIDVPDLSGIPIVTVMSNARDDFFHKYEVIREIGKGGFSTVHQCRNKTTKVDYAVKVIECDVKRGEWFLIVL